MYAVAAQRWADEGRTAHYALVPATDSVAVDAWFRLGFGHQHTHALAAHLDQRVQTGTYCCYASDPLSPTVWEV